MRIFKGKGVCEGIVFGKISVLKKDERKIERKEISDIKKETERFENAKKSVISELSDLKEKALLKVGGENAEIFEIHMMMAEDEDYNDFIKDMIKNKKLNAEYAVFSASERFSDMFLSMESDYMKARSSDIKEISERIITHLSGKKKDAIEGEKVIICADDLSPGETVLLDKGKILSFAVAKGSSNSHTAILARSMDIPAVVSIGDDFLSFVKNGDYAVIDGTAGEVVINPDEKTISVYKEKESLLKEKKESLKNLREKETVTLDGKKINLFANIGDFKNIPDAKENGADGIGLFRSEFIFIGKDDFPSEDYQFSLYKKVLEEMNGRKVIIRTLDIGADKKADYLRIPDEENPALGLRGIRLCLSRPDVFRTQLRALYRASVFGNLGIMFPMINDVKDTNETLSICKSIRDELTKEGIPFDEKTELGIMIETPAAALISDELAKTVSFFSIGTNDLIQYTLACDRQNESVEKFCNTHHKAVLSLIEMTIKNAHKNGIWAGICGELASDISLTETFLQMGVDELSVSPGFILMLKEKIRGINLF